MSSTVPSPSPENDSPKTHVFEFTHEALSSASTCRVVHQRGRGIAWRIWPGARIFADWLCHHPELVRGHTVLDLGAGVGLVGVVCAGLGALAVCLSDLAEVVEGLERSKSANEPAVAERIMAREVHFGQTDHIDSAIAALRDASLSDNDTDVSPPVLLASDVVYWESVHLPLADTLAYACCHLGARCFMAYTKRDAKVEKRFFTKVLKQRGLRVRVLEELLYADVDNTSQNTESAVEILARRCLAEPLDVANGEDSAAVLATGKNGDLFENASGQTSEWNARVVVIEADPATASAMARGTPHDDDGNLARIKEHTEQFSKQKRNKKKSASVKAAVHPVESILSQEQNTEETIKEPQLNQREKKELRRLAAKQKAHSGSTGRRGK